MKTTLAKREFKDRLGQANHFLITSLIGLDGIESGKISEKPSSFSTSWNPKNVIRSAERSRIFLLKSFLGWAVESLEMYLTELNRKPKLLESEKFTELYSKAGRSIYLKTILIGDELKIDPVLVGLMEVLITWRNYTFHYDVDNTIRDSSFEVLLNEEKRISTEFCGLEVVQLKKTWETGGDFTFKETASLINATQKFVSAIDTYILNNLNFEQYYSEILIEHFDKNSNSKQKYLTSQGMEKFILVLLQNIAGVTEVKNIQQVLSLVKNHYRK